MHLSTTMRALGLSPPRHWICAWMILCLPVTGATVSASAAAPAITQLAPSSGTPGSLVVITGAHFSGIPEENIVRFRAVRAEVLCAGPGTLFVLVPAGSTYAPVTVTVDGLTAYSDQFFIPTSLGTGSQIGGSSFSPGVNLPAARGPVRVVISDLDVDGRPDLAVGNDYGNVVSVYRNVGAPGELTPDSFAPRFELPTGGGRVNPYWIVAADLDGDGRPDLVSTEYSSGRIRIFRNESVPGALSPGSFGPPVEFPVGGTPQRVTVFDLNGDARPEIITANTTPAISILPNQGPRFQLDENSFGPSVNLPTSSGTHGISVGDLDGDGFPDLVTTHFSASFLTVFRNLGTAGPVTPASFTSPVHVPAPSQGVMVRIADVDKDGRLDLITGSYLGRNMAVLRNTSTPGLLAPDSFEPYVTFPLGGRAHNVGLGDLNGSGSLDLAMATEISSSITLFENLSTPGSFTNGSLGPQVILPTGLNAWGVSVGDLDLDGRPDIVFANQYHNTLTLYHNQMPANQPPVADAEATPPLVISPNNVDATVVLNGTRSFDPEGDALAYAWFASCSQDLLATDVVATVAFPVGAHRVDLVVDDGLAEDSDAVTVEVITQATAIEMLMRDVSDTVERSRPLLATLRAALASIDRGASLPSVSQLQTFQNKVRAQVAPVDAELASTLIRQAQDIIDAIAGGHGS